MKTIYIKFINLILIIAFLFNCGQQYNCIDLGPAPFSIHTFDSYNFGTVPVNNSTDYKEYYISNDGHNGACYTACYRSVNIKITISDNVNFTIDTSKTDKTISCDSSTSFFVKFNPKSSGTFNAVIKVDAIDSSRDGSVTIQGIGVE